MPRVFRGGCRPSPLALRQVEEVLAKTREFFPSFAVEAVTISTRGDKDKATPISRVEGTDFFTDAIEGALVNGEIDFAVHSAKDLPPAIPSGLIIAAVTASIDGDEAFISSSGLKLAELPLRAKIGTSSRRRKEGLKKYRPDFRIIDLRGNIEQRLKLMEEKNLDGIVLAACALRRLGLEGRITQRVPFDIIEPHPLQGALAVETRVEEKEIIDIFSRLRGQTSKFQSSGGRTSGLEFKKQKIILTEPTICRGGRR